MPRGESAPGLPQGDVPVLLRIDDALDPQGLVRARYDAEPGLVVLLRPDQHVCARLHHPTAAELQSAMRRALADDAAIEEMSACR